MRQEKMDKSISKQPVLKEEKDDPPKRTKSTEHLYKPTTTAAPTQLLLQLQRMLLLQLLLQLQRILINNRKIMHLKIQLTNLQQL